MPTFLYVTPPVASLQFDIDPGLAVQLDPSVPKILGTHQLDGKTRVLVYGLDQTVFSGKFAIADGPINTITGVVGAAPDGTDAHATVSKLSKIGPVTLTVTGTVTGT